MGLGHTTQSSNMLAGELGRHAEQTLEDAVSHVKQLGFCFVGSVQLLGDMSREVTFPNPHLLRG